MSMRDGLEEVCARGNISLQLEKEWTGESDDGGDI